MKARPGLLHPDSPPWLEVYQLTTDTHVPGSHVYMEAQIFAPDSRRLVLHRSAHAHGGDQHDPEHRYLLCDLEQGGELAPLTTETGATAPSVSPDGQHLYYFVDETEVCGGRLTLKRVRLDGTQRETLLVVDAPLAGTDLRPSLIYPLSTISSDGKRLALPAFLRYGEREDLPWGLLAFDVEEGDVSVVMYGSDWTNIHAQYCRSLDPDASHDILCQHNHSHFFDRTGGRHFSPGGLGNDIHVIRDDGTHWRTMPWGRDGRERQAGHECWIGRSTRAISEVMDLATGEMRLIEGTAGSFAGHIGALTPGARRNDLSRSFPNPHFVHFGVDIAGRRIIADQYAAPPSPDVWISLADLPSDGSSPASNWTPLLSVRSPWSKDTHAHPFLSPDGRTGFFNSAESGILQAYMVRGWS